MVAKQCNSHIFPNLRERRPKFGIVLLLAAVAIYLPDTNKAWAGNPTAPVTSLNADFVNTAFDHTSGQLLVQSNNTVLEIKRSDDSSETMTNVTISLILSLVTDTSNGLGLASGNFNGSLATVDNNSATDLMTASVPAFNAQEVDVNLGSISIHQFSCTGSFNQAQGSLVNGSADYGDIVSLQINLDHNPDNFLDTDYSGTSKITLLPIPEPASIFLLLVSSAFLFTRKNRLSADNNANTANARLLEKRMIGLRNKINLKVLGIIALCTAFISIQAQAQSVVEIGGASMHTDFSSGGIGSTLSIVEENTFPPFSGGGTTIFIKYSDNSISQYPNGEFILTGLTLIHDNSINGMAMGLFADGDLIIRDNEDNNLFTADIDQLLLVEAAPNILSGSGIYSNGVMNITGATPLPASGTIEDITFSLSINDFVDFNTGFSALSSIDIVPEPATLALLAGALMMLLRKRRV